MVNEFNYLVDDKNYKVLITYKRIKNVHYRFNGECFLVSAPKRISLSFIISGLDKFAKKLIKNCVKNTAIGDDFIYIFGNKYSLNYPGELCVNNMHISYKNEKDFNKKIKEWFLSYLINRTSELEQIMNAPHFNIKLRKMTSRYGSNNRSKKTITYSLILLHYAKDIIDSVIIHELAHHFVYNHSDKFYNVVYKYCPRYDILRKKLIKAELV